MILIEPAKHVTYHYLQSHHPHHMTYRAQSLVQAYKGVPPTSSLATLQRFSPCEFQSKIELTSISIKKSSSLNFSYQCSISNDLKLNIGHLVGRLMFIFSIDCFLWACLISTPFSSSSTHLWQTPREEDKVVFKSNLVEM